MKLKLKIKERFNNLSSFQKTRLVLIVLIFIITGLWVASIIEQRESKNENEYQNKKNTTSTVSRTKTSTNKAAQEKIDSNTLIVEEDDYVIGEGMIDWQTPKDVGDLELTSKEIFEGDGSIKYVKVGDIVEGKYEGGEIFDFISWLGGGPQVNPEIFRAIKKDRKFYILNYGLDKYSVSTIEENFKERKSEVFWLSGVLIKELIYPEEIMAPDGKTILSKDKYSEAFFVNVNLRKAFVHSEYGQVWITKSGNQKDSQLELNAHKYYNGEKVYHDIFKTGGLYLRAPDGTTVTYKLSFNNVIVEDDYSDRMGALDVTWNDGTKNDISYELHHGGCGVTNHVYDKTSAVDKNELIVVGKTSGGDDILGFKDTKSEELQDFYDNVYWVKDGENKLSKEEILKGHPEVFWEDPFGRLLGFYNSNFFPAVECGKPVIYLYPEKEMNVDVKVEPTGGITISDPSYENGWKVSATPESEITDLKDGKKYPYLFWEGKSDMLYQMPKVGFVVSRDSLRAFLDEKLKKLGLIKKEITDFKEFWLPKLQAIDKPYYFITFLSQNDINKMAPLEVNPAPDVVIRVLMDYQGLDEYKNVPEFEIKTPERKGFTVVEWGGVLK